MSQATAMSNAERVEHYLAQNGATRLTPAQRRRLAKVTHRAARVADVPRPSRLRKATEAKRRRDVRAVGAQVVGLVRYLRARRAPQPLDRH